MAQINFTHTVLFWLNNPNHENDIATFTQALKKFISNSVFIESSFIGTPSSKERSVTDDSYTFLLTVGFQSKEMQDAYQKEDAHQEFLSTTNHLWNRVLVYDAETI
jgi:hypothetical protein